MANDIGRNMVEWIIQNVHVLSQDDPYCSLTAGLDQWVVNIHCENRTRIYIKDENEQILWTTGCRNEWATGRG